MPVMHSDNDVAVAIDDIETYRKLVSLLVHRCEGKETFITAKELTDFPQDNFLIVHFQADGIKLKLVSEAEAHRIVQERLSAKKPN